MKHMSLAEFADQMNGCMAVISREFLRQLSGKFEDFKISMPQVHVLTLLYENGAHKMSDLAKAMYVTTAAMTGFIDRLVRDGYVVRENDEHDRRIVKVSLTEKGRALMCRLKQHKRKTVISLFSKVSESDRELYLSILRRMENGIKKDLK